MADEKPTSAEELRARAERAQAHLDKARGAKPERGEDQQKEDLGMVANFLAKFRNLGNLPILRFSRPIFHFLGPKYVWAFNKLTTKKDGSSTLSRQAFAFAGLTLGSLVALWFIVFSLIPNTFRLAYDAVVINTFAYEDVLVFGKPDWVEGEPGVLSVFACRKYPCEGQSDSIEFRMRDSFYLDVVRTLTRLEPHDPGELAGAFLSEENACRFKAYGVRVKYLGFYPSLIEATCRPINGENAKSALQEMAVGSGE